MGPYISPGEEDEEEEEEAAVANGISSSPHTEVTKERERESGKEREES